jgi:tetratricopeptide (TPR) repeat protein
MTRFSKTCLFFVAGILFAAAPLSGKVDSATAATGAGIPKMETALTAPDQGVQREFLVPKKRLTAREWVQKGSEFLASGNYENAGKAFSNAIELNEGFLLILNKTTAMHMRYGNCELANNDLKKTADVESHLAFVYCQRGLTFREWGKAQEAIFDFDRAIRLDPNLSLAYLERGRAYQKIGDYRRAVDNYNLALKGDPQNPIAYCERGSAYIKLEFFPLAMLDCDKAIEINPQYARAYFERGISYQRTGNAEKGLQNFKTAAALGSREAQDLLKAAGVQW